MTDARARGEMPFLDHLEELRWRILWSLLALAVGTGLGYVVVERFDVLDLLMRPIEPFLPSGKLFITRPTDAFLLTVKLSLFVGVVGAAPVIAWQAWRFFSPALYERERRFAIPAMAAGTILFAVGVAVAYRYALPAALRILFSFQRADLESIITADEYFGFAAQFVLAFGVMFELPLIIVLLAAFRLVNPRFFAKHRRYALVVAAIVAAVLTPPDALSMMMLLIPLLLLYEGGIAVARLVWARGNRDAAAAALLLLLAGLAFPGDAHAQKGPPPRRVNRDSARVQLPDSLRGPNDTTRGIDTATARRLGLPTAPSRTFPAADSVLQALLALTGFQVIRYAADSVVLFADSQAVGLVGTGLLEQGGATLEADTVRFRQASCDLRARGGPTLFQEGTVLVGDRMRYDTCERRGFVDSALTNFNQTGVDWFLRGNLSADSSMVRLFAEGRSLTSCDVGEPHYHFAAGHVKWVRNTMLVARPTVLYVRDVPVLWLPFIFQDMRQGRRSGLLVPRFGINDLVRPNTGYERHITNIGYYVAFSDYLDAQASLDWFSGSSVALRGAVRYRWLNRFVAGGLQLTRQWEKGSGASRSLLLEWRHNQDFDLGTSLRAAVTYATSSRVVERNAIDPFRATENLRSSLNFNKRFDWGSMSVGGDLTQDLSNGGVQQNFPSLVVTPNPLDLTSFITWSPTLAVTNSRTYHQFGGLVPVPGMPGDTAPRTDSLLTESRNSSLRFNTPLRLGGWTWDNSLSVADQIREAFTSQTTGDSLSPDTTTSFYGLDFSTAIDWTTSFGLPALFPGSWKLQPRIGIQNTTTGSFWLRNRNTNGTFVQQSKRLSFEARITPSVFGFFPGFGPVARIRHKFSPSVRWGYAPSATIPEAYARALRGRPTDSLVLRSPVQHSLTFGLSQNFEAKLRPPPGDTTTDPRQARKVKLLGIETTGLTYDFEQAKLDGRNGWQTQTLSNTFTTDLLPGFSLATTHDLWRGPVGFDSAAFDPFLTRISARFTISEGTVRGVVGLLTGRGLGGASTAAGPAAPLDTAVNEGRILPPSRGDRYADYDLRPHPGVGRQPFSLAVTYDDQRNRPLASPDTTSVGPALPPNRTLGLSFGFDPTQNWSLSWTTQYNLTTHEFGQHVVRLERDLHRWRATFQFLKSPNGNFAFNFFISLLDQPDIKFQYDQQTVDR